jgi:hypothetical protein
MEKKFFEEGDIVWALNSHQIYWPSKVPKIIKKDKGNLER